MEYKHQQPSAPKTKPRLIIHGGAGNMAPSNIPPERYREYRAALLTVVSRTNAYMLTPVSPSPDDHYGGSQRLPSALDVATHAVTQLEDNPLFNAGKGAVFTRDGINELEASVMVSRGHAKRGVAVSGIRTVKNPIQLARRMLEHGDGDLEGKSSSSSSSSSEERGESDSDRDVPSAQAHTHLHGVAVTTALAEEYGLELVDGATYYFTQRRWDEHVRALEREKEKKRTMGVAGSGSGCCSASWSADEYLPQGTVGAVALDEDGVVCVATSTGGLTNKLSGRVGDTPTVGAGFWAGEWEDDLSVTATDLAGGRWPSSMRGDGPGVVLTGALRGLMADCLPSPFLYAPVSRPASSTRSFAGSGTGNGDSFLRVAALRSVAARAQWRPESSADALTAIAGPGGELQRSAGDRWGRTGEGEGGVIGIEHVVLRDAEGEVVGTSSEVIQDFNCGGMARAWIDKAGKARMRIWRDDEAALDRSLVVQEESAEDVRDWISEKDGAYVC